MTYFTRGMLIAKVCSNTVIRSFNRIEFEVVEILVIELFRVLRSLSYPWIREEKWLLQVISRHVVQEGGTRQNLVGILVPIKKDKV